MCQPTEKEKIPGSKTPAKKAAKKTPAKKAAKKTPVKKTPMKTKVTEEKISSDNSIPWGLLTVFLLVGIIACLLLIMVFSGFNQNQVSEEPTPEPESEVNFVHSDEFTAEEFKRKSGYTIRFEVEKIVGFDIFYQNNGVPVAVPIIQIGDSVGPYLSDSPPKSEIRPTGELWVGSEYQHVKVVDDNGLLFPGFPLIRNTVTGKYKTHTIALVPRTQ